MHTEITDNTVRQAAGWVYYDGECRLCRNWLAGVERPLTKHGFRFIPLQSPAAREALGLNDAELLREMKLRFADGRLLGGADAVLALARHVWWLTPLWILGQLPGGLVLIRRVYRIIAAHRRCGNGMCEIAPRRTWLDWLPLLVLPVVTICLRNQFADWVFMWLLALAIFFACKWLTWRRAVDRSVPWTRTLGYLLAWPGMGAKEFFAPAKPGAEIKPQYWFVAVAKAILGAALLMFASELAINIPTPLVGWMGMLGVVLLLHFGLFDLMALVWQFAGVSAKPVMRSPLRAPSLGEFWGERWNTAFNKLAHDLAFRSLARRFDPRLALLGVFLISGFVHDLVISLPARAGFGLPTAYFLLQGTAVLFERSRPGKRLGLGRGARGCVFMLAVTALPAYWLFHPPFVHHVILPMLQAIGANWSTP